MKILLGVMCLINVEYLYSQSSAWTQKADFGDTARIYAVGFSIGSKGYIGTGEVVGGGYTKDFWEYMP